MIWLSSALRPKSRSARDYESSLSGPKSIIGNGLNEGLANAGPFFVEGIGLISMSFIYYWLKLVIIVCFQPKISKANIPLLLGIFERNSYIYKGPILVDCGKGGTFDNNRETVNSI